MPPLLYPFPPLLRGTLVRRYKRFFADIELDSGELVVAHCPNTGPMTGICIPGNRVMVCPNDDPKRKLRYTWELIDIDGTWVGVNTGLPNRVVRQLLEQHLVPELGDYTEVRSEVKYGSDGRSRVDFLLEGGDRPVYVEVKNTTWTDGSLALFPDTVTTRGQKHLREMTDLLPTARAATIYFINRGDCDRFAPGDSKDPDYGQLLRAGVAAGLEVYPCRFRTTPEGLTYLGLARVEL